MMPREEDLIRIAKKLDKMASRNNTEGALDLLKELKNYSMTLKLLQETRIGMSVNGIRKHCTDEKIVSLAKVLIKDWKRLLDAARSQSTERPDEIKNGTGVNKSTGSPVRSSSQKEPRLQRSDDFDPDSEKEEHSNKQQIEKNYVQYKQHNTAVKVKKKSQTDAFRNKCHLEENNKGKYMEDLRKQRPADFTNNEPHLEEPKKERNSDEIRKGRLVTEHYLHNEKEFGEPKKEKHTHQPRKERFTDRHKDGRRKEKTLDTLNDVRTQERPAENYSQVFERKSVLDDLYPSFYTPPLPPRPIPIPPICRHPSVEVKKVLKKEVKKEVKNVLKKERKKAPPDCDSQLPHLHHPKPSAAEIKARKETPKTHISQLVRKEPLDPNAPFAPLPLHLHPPAVKHPSVEGKDRKDSSDSKLFSLKRMSSEHFKKDRKDSSDMKGPKTPVDTKNERKDSTDSKPKPEKKSSPNVPVSKPKPPKSLDCKNDRKDSTDSRPIHPVKLHSRDSRSDRRDSMDSKSTTSPSATKNTSESLESHGFKPSHPGPLQRTPSTDSSDRRGKPETPTSPTSPMSPSFSPAGGPLSPRLLTGETIRDKCIEMLAAALRTDDNYKEFGTNCDSMAAEIEDHIYKEMGATDMKYKNRVRSRISNLKDLKNPGLRRNVLAGGIELRHFAIMSAEEMASDELKQLRNDLTKEAIREHQLSKTSGTISDLFQCSKCRKKNCTYNQVQTRSADEPMTTFVLCNECGNRWKFC